MANKSLVNLWKRFYYYYFLSLFSYKKTAKVYKVPDEFMYYISNHSPKLAPLLSPRPSTTPPPPPPLMKRTYNCPRVTWGRTFCLRGDSLLLFVFKLSLLACVKLDLHSKSSVFINSWGAVSFITGSINFRTATRRIMQEEVTKWKWLPPLFFLLIYDYFSAFNKLKYLLDVNYFKTWYLLIFLNSFSPVMV